MLFELMVKAVQIITFLVGPVIFFSICYYVGITNTSAVQRYRAIHEFRKTDLNETISNTRTNIIQMRIFNNTAANVTEKTPYINLNRVSSFNGGIANYSSAIQRYRNLHEFRKPDRNDNRPTPITNNNFYRSIIDDTDAVTSGKTSNIDVNDVQKTSTKNKKMTLSSFWNFIRLASETYFTETRNSTAITEDYSTTSITITSTSTTTTSSPTSPKTPTSSSSTSTPILRTTNVLPSLASTRKLSASSTIGCTATCGSCKEITSISGVIMSPNYPEHYYSPTDIGYTYCYYTINVPVGKKIHLVFQELNLAFTDQGDFIEVVDKSPQNYGKVLATFDAGDEGVATMTIGESMLVFFEANPGGYTKNGKAPVWKAAYRAVEK